MHQPLLNYKNKSEFSISSQSTKYNVKNRILWDSIPLDIKQQVAISLSILRHLRPAGFSDKGVTAPQPSIFTGVTDMTDVVSFKTEKL